MRRFAAVNSPPAIDAVIRAAVLDAVSGLAPRVDVAGEDRLRTALVDALRRRTDWRIKTERSVPIPEFQGVGPVDIVLCNADNAAPWGLIECKWSSDIRRDTIIEGAWDAVKLALATRQNDEAGWLITAAPTGSWRTTETVDLFAPGIVHTRQLWSRRLQTRGRNGGNTVGEECELGGRGNMFTHAPSRLMIQPVAKTHTPSGGWEVRASRVRAQGPLVRFGDPPEFPPRISQEWLEERVPDMDEETFEKLLTRLRLKRWTEAEISGRVLWLRKPHP